MRRLTSAFVKKLETVNQGGAVLPPYANERILTWIYRRLDGFAPSNSVTPVFFRATHLSLARNLISNVTKPKQLVLRFLAEERPGVSSFTRFLPDVFPFSLPNI